MTTALLNGAPSTEESVASVLATFVELDKVKPPLDKPTHSTVFEVSQETNKITIPANMDKVAVADAILKMAKEESAETTLFHEFDCHPNDGAVNFTRLLSEAFGDIRAKGMFGGWIPPASVQVPVGLGVTESVVVQGSLSIPFLPDVEFSFHPNFAEAKLTISTSCQNKHKAAIEKVMAALRVRLRTDSIYKGKAIDSKYTFLDVRSATSDGLIFNDEVLAQLSSNIFTPLSNRAALTQYGIPFKRGVLLEGDYGTGKTLVAYVAANIAQEHNVTFIYIRPEDYKQIPTYIAIAKRYAPCVLFSEDIDGQANGNDDERSTTVNTILTALDGIESKQSNELMVIMTTNHVENINPAILRPGRIDAVIHMAKPDIVAAGNLIKLYGRDTLHQDFDFTRAGEACEGMVPAFIRECVERAKLYAIERDPQHLALSHLDVIYAANGMKRHLALATPVAQTSTPESRLADSLREVLGTAVAAELSKMVDGNYLLQTFEKAEGS